MKKLRRFFWGGFSTCFLMFVLMLFISLPGPTNSSAKKFLCETYKIPFEEMELCWGDFHRESFIIYEVHGRKNWISNFHQLTDPKEFQATREMLQRRSTPAKVDVSTPIALYRHRGKTWTTFVIEVMDHTYLLFFSAQCL